MSLETFSLSVRLANAVASYLTYVEKMFWPVNLSIFYPHPGQIGTGRLLTALVFIVVVSWVAVKWCDRRPWFLMGWLWYLLTLLPVIGIVQVGMQAFADRYTYLPFIGLFVMVAWGGREAIAAGRFAKPLSTFLAAVSLCTLAVFSFLYVGQWRDSLTLFRHGLGVTSGNYVLHNNLGYELKQAGKIAEAISHYRKAIEFKPDFEMAHTNLGSALVAMERTEECVRHYQNLLRVHPSFPVVHNHLGILMLQSGDLKSASFHFQEALRYRNDYAEAYNSLGAVTLYLGQVDGAKALFEKSLLLKPELLEAGANLAGLIAAEDTETGKPTIIRLKY